MTLGERLALTHPWWMWSHPRITEAIAQAHLEYWLPLYQGILDQNEKNGHSPTRKTINGDHFLCRDNRSVERMEAGSKQLSGRMLLGLAYSLDLPIAKLFPPWEDWIAEATKLLLEGGNRHKGLVPKRQVKGYALYRFQAKAPEGIRDEPSLDRAVLDGICQIDGQGFLDWREAEQAILRVSQLLGPILEECMKP